MMSSPTSNTQAALLLCARLGQSDAGDAVKPLTLRQYSALAKWLQERSLQPSDLLQPNDRGQLSGLQLHEVAGEQVERLLDRGAALGVMVERWTNSGLWILGREDESYPSRYRTYLEHRAPPIIFGVGKPSSLQDGGLAVVGSRQASEEDLAFAQRVGAACADQAVITISGAAKGIDAEAMMSAIHQRGSAIGVLAEGLGRAAVAEAYREAILDGRLTLITPYEPESRWFTFTAMERNKLIYALADAALVVAASDQQGGTWAGAVEALKQGRIPIYVKRSGEVPAGNRKLIRSGAFEFLEETLSDLRILFDKSGSPDKLQFEDSVPSNPDDRAPEEIDASLPPCPSVSSVVTTLTSAAKQKKKGRKKTPTTEKAVEAILALLVNPMDAASLALKLSWSLSETQAVLKRALQEGGIEKIRKQRRVQYALKTAALPLFAHEPELAPAKKA